MSPVMLKKKLCLFIHALSPGGMERVMSQIATYLAQKQGVEVHLVLYGIDREIFYPIPESAIVHRPRFEFQNTRRFLSTIKTCWFLRRTVKSIKPDCLLSFGEVWNNLVLLALVGLNYPLYVADRSRPGKDLGRLHNRLKTCLYPNASGLLVQTDRARQLALQTGLNTKIAVIGNPVRIVEAGSSESKENIVLMVSRLVRTKHVDRLIRMFERIGLPDWKLIIVGGDAQRQSLMSGLQSLVKELSLTDRVFLEGTQSNVDSYYRKAKIFAFTSSSEGFPNVVGEALSAGLPVVSYDCVAGPSEMITDGENGFLVPVFDDQVFEQRLRILMEDEVLRKRMAKNARPSIERFSLDIIGEQFYEFIMPR